MDEVKDFLKSRTFCNLFIIFVNIAVFLIMEIQRMWSSCCVMVRLTHRGL